MWLQSSIILRNSLQLSDRLDTTRLPVVGLVGEWLFDNATPATIQGTSGNNHHGTNVGLFTSDTALGTGHSLDFFGGNKYGWVTTGGNETVFSGGDAFWTIWYKGCRRRLGKPDGQTQGENQGGWKIAKMNTTCLFYQGTQGGYGS